ncbi:MAG: hypothetical protein Q4C95_12450 [Planctomycetia bacterium]|nr:hypothetical protein [Planctomycetia bacterium]
MNTSDGVDVDELTAELESSIETLKMEDEGINDLKKTSYKTKKTVPDIDVMEKLKQLEETYSQESPPLPEKEPQNKKIADSIISKKMEELEETN